NAAMAVDERTKVAALNMARIQALRDSVTLTCNCFDRVIKTMTTATVIEPGMAATDGPALARLVNELKPDAPVQIAGDDHPVVVSCSRSRWRLPALPVADLPAVPALDGEPASVTLASEDLRRGLSFTSFAVADDARHYLT